MKLMPVHRLDKWQTLAERLLRGTLARERLGKGFTLVERLVDIAPTTIKRQAYPTRVTDLFPDVLQRV